MSLSLIKTRFLKRLLFILSLAASAGAGANTIVTMDTSMGNFSIELYDSAAPNTVANFLSYVDSGAYSNSFIQRSVPGFVIQG
ncbi:MAG: peptidylprolyl isomerase, partial [Methylomonas sp.]